MLERLDRLYEERGDEHAVRRYRQFVGADAAGERNVTAPLLDEGRAGYGAAWH